MFPQKISDIARLLKVRVAITSDYQINSVCIDSRYAAAGNSTLFVALAGKRSDGHVYIPELYRRGVRCFVTDEYYQPDFTAGNAVFIPCSSPLRALQEIAAQQRSLFNREVTAITGSNGKTIVKEWISHLLAPYTRITKSPKSFNSQIGVPLSVIGLNAQSELGVFEAGISQPGEMEVLAQIIQPTIGVFTNLGNSHQQNFENSAQKLTEKLNLFSSCNTILYCADSEDVATEIENRFGNKSLISWSLLGKRASADVKISQQSKQTAISVSYCGSQADFFIPFTDRPSVENAVTSYLLAKTLLPSADISKMMESLPQVEMRLNFVEGVRNSLLINDCYSSDLESIHAAIQTLGEQKAKERKIVILSDFDFPAHSKPAIIHSIMDQLVQIGTDALHVVSQSGIQLPAVPVPVFTYTSTQEFIQRIRLQDYADSCILIKGSRQYLFEQIVKKLEKSAHQTVLEVNLTAIANNLSYFQSLIAPETKVMAMVKGYSYGSGDYEIAELLRSRKADYLAVAFVDEGIVLRQKGVSLPIAVMNPEVENYSTMIDYMLEPEVYSINSLLRLLEETRMYSSSPIKIHIKLDTGMHRLGFETKDLPALLEILQRHKWIQVVSVFSHLACADDPSMDYFTHQQAELFRTGADTIEKHLGYPVIKHLLNSPGTERFPQYQFDMVRLGIGLYGISSLQDKKLEHISTLKTVLSQIRTVPAGETVGYSRKGKVTEETRIGVLPIGYADGYDRRFSNGVGKVLINGHLVPIIGNVCMDACMVNLGNIPAAEGDEAIIFSENLPISILAEQIGTIPYEILTNVSKRVKRVYLQE